VDISDQHCRPHLCSKFSKASCYDPARRIQPPLLNPVEALSAYRSGQEGAAANMEEKAVEMLRLLTLLLPPQNRRKLQLLLKFIRKVKELPNNCAKCTLVTYLFLKNLDTRQFTFRLQEFLRFRQIFLHIVLREMVDSNSD
jgi:hypothetical protein